MASERILVVEDEDLNARLIRQRLTYFGYSVPAIVTTGEQAVEQAAACAPDLVLMDIDLAGRMDGVEAAALIRERYNVPVVFMTGLLDDSVLRRAKVTEPFGFIVKPFEDRQLQTSIELALYQHKAENKLKQIEHWFTTTIRCMGDAVIVTDQAGRITLINSVAERLTGWSQNDAAGRDLRQVLTVKDSAAPAPDAAVDLAAKAMREGILPVLTAGQTVLIPRQGDPIPVEGNASSIRDGQGHRIGVVLAFRDVTRRKQAEDDLWRSREELRALSARLQSVREEERTGIAREIHDELGQILTGLKIDLAWFARKLRPDQRPLQQKTREMIGLVDETIQTVRKIATALRPGLLDDLGLAAAIEWQAEEFQARTGITCHCRIAAAIPPLEGDWSTALFRIFQETLTNIARHAQATRVEIRFEERDRSLELEIKDNGRGITETQLSNSKSLGLIGMRERALILGGRVQITGVPGKGTTVSVVIPRST